LQEGKRGEPVSGATSPLRNGNDAWVEVGPKQKSTTTRSTEIKVTPVVSIFGGKTRSVLKAQGDKESSTVEPFERLQLDIGPDNIQSIEDALQNLTSIETIHGYTSQSLGIPVDATKQTFIEHFPPILILHMKRFGYNSVGGFHKLQKYVTFDAGLKIRAEVLSPGLRKSQANLQYRLFAVVNHHGKGLANGHYTCDVLRQNEEWLRIDDDEVRRIDVAEVVKEQEDRQPYMLFFAKS
ncbi:hypothetical protein HDU98_005740, partial [Podochytrium sp. JEL0797]